MLTKKLAKSANKAALFADLASFFVSTRARGGAPPIVCHTYDMVPQTLILFIICAELSKIQQHCLDLAAAAPPLCRRHQPLARHPPPATRHRRRLLHRHHSVTVDAVGSPPSDRRRYRCRRWTAVQRAVRGQQDGRNPTLNSVQFARG